MLTVDEALERILATVAPLAAEDVPLGDALGRVLADDLVSGIDSPPFDKSLMDGFAVRASDVADGRAELIVGETITAGMVSTMVVEAGRAARIMTGAPIPAGADAVVQVEHTSYDDVIGTVKIETQPVEPGRNIITRATNTRVGETVLRSGRILRPQEVGTLAELGGATVTVHRRPRVAILATGDELVPIDTTPGPGQIRNSNESMLVAQVRRLGAEPVPLGIARDERSHLRERIDAGLECDFLLLSGGVSVGLLDLVPSELAAAGVREVFHKVHVKPGKPVWFGVREGRSPASRTGVDASSESDAERGCDVSRIRDAGLLAEVALEHGESANIEVDASSGAVVVDGRRLSDEEVGTLTGRAASRSARRRMEAQIAGYPPGTTYVFGLPGNPVSSMVCAELFARTAIRQAMGLDPVTPTSTPARLAHDHIARGDRPVYHPARIEWTAEGAMVHLVPWHGSSDLRATVEANGMALIPPGNAAHPAGTIVETFGW